MTKVISLFNHKGGVSKTTTTFHLGWSLANMGLKVLMVDADPQCNLTGLSLGIEDYESLFKFYDSRQNENIYTSLSGVFGFGGNNEYKNGVIPTKTKNNNLSLLAGHINFAKFDLQLATALTSSNSIPVLKPLLSSINTLIRRTAELGQFDIVLIDMSPSISATNMCIFMASDYFIVPTSPDFYCYQAIDSLSEVLPDWSVRMSHFKDEIILPRSNPKMLGVISQNYRVYGKDDNEDSKMTGAFLEWADKIRDITISKLSPCLKKANMIIDEDFFKEVIKHDKPYNLANIQDFNTLIPTSQKLSKPIFELNDQDGNWAGAVWTRKQNNKDVGVKHKIEEAKLVFQRLAESICKLIQLPTYADREKFDKLLKQACKPLE
jgi:chromosome partitioning protein